MNVLATLNQFDKLDIYIVIVVIAVMLLLFKLKPPIPSIGTIQIAIELLNTKGGIIAVLGMMSLIFFFVGVHFIYWSANMILDGKISTDNAIVISGFNWITGIAFGGVFGAMIKTMTGESPAAPASMSTTTTTSTRSVQTNSDNGINPVAVTQEATTTVTPPSTSIT